MNSINDNPLLSEKAVPQFSSISASDVLPGIEALLARAERALEEVTRPEARPADYQALTSVLEPPLQALDDAWGVVAHLNSVANTPELRTAFAQAQPKVMDFFARMSTDQRLYALYKRIREEGGARMSELQRRALDNTLRDLKLAGAELPSDRKERFVATQQRSAELSREFSNRLLDATEQYVHWASAEEVKGASADVLAAMNLAATREGHDSGVYKVTLHQPCLGPLMRQAQNRQMRELLYHANVTRASEFGPATMNNAPLVAEILKLRHERAALLGYACHAEVSLVPKMAESSAQVFRFLDDIGSSARAQAERELAELRAFARDHLQVEDLQPWDVAYASEKLREARYSFSDEEVKQYFTLDKVLAGLFEIAETLFDIRVHSEAQPVWNESVRAFRIEREGELLGRFFLDPYARRGKNAGAWMNGARALWRMPSGEIRPALAHLVTNFAAPVGDKPALMSHDEVVTLFHEMGHALHFLLSRVDVLGISGISGVEWDAVELPSQMMENFAWEWSVLQRISAHASTREPLPRELFEKMWAARNFHSAGQLLRQVEMALFDMRMHAEPARSDEAQCVLDEVRDEHALIRPPSYNRFQNSFSHIFAGPYDAGYYSYLWAEVLAADAWSVFQQEGVLDPVTGKRYQEAILERGGSRPMRENFRDFAGREPRNDALLKQRGILTP